MKYRKLVFRVVACPVKSVSNAFDFADIKLRRFYRTHTGETPWACSLCDAKFNRLHHFRQTNTSFRPILINWWIAFDRINWWIAFDSGIIFCCTLYRQHLNSIVHSRRIEGLKLKGTYVWFLIVNSLAQLAARVGFCSWFNLHNFPCSVSYTSFEKVTSLCLKDYHHFHQ